MIIAFSAGSPKKTERSSMVSVIDKIAAEHENIIKVLDEIRKASKREEMEMVVLVGIGAYINNVYNGIENILKQILLSRNIV
jgi:phosphopantothenate synthetase